MGAQQSRGENQNNEGFRKHARGVAYFDFIFAFISLMVYLLVALTTIWSALSGRKSIPIIATGYTVIIGVLAFFWRIIDVFIALELLKATNPGLSLQGSLQRCTLWSYYNFVYLAGMLLYFLVTFNLLILVRIMIRVYFLLTVYIFMQELGHEMLIQAHRD